MGELSLWSVWNWLSVVIYYAYFTSKHMLVLFLKQVFFSSMTLQITDRINGRKEKPSRPKKNKVFSRGNWRRWKRWVAWAVKSTGMKWPRKGAASGRTEEWRMLASVVQPRLLSSMAGLLWWLFLCFALFILVSVFTLLYSWNIFSSSAAFSLCPVITLCFSTRPQVSEFQVMPLNKNCSTHFNMITSHLYI